MRLVLKTALFCGAILVFAQVSTGARAQCQNSPLVTQSTSSDAGLQFSMATMNRNGVASYASGFLSFVPAARLPGGQLPARWVTKSQASQEFSDRNLFNSSQADKISLSITAASTPQATITLNSHGNGTSTFSVTCSATGILHGATPDVEYLFFLSPAPSIQ